MQTQYQKVREFMQAFGQECPPYPAIPAQDIRELRFELIDEERDEFRDAKTEVDRFDAILDMSYVIMGAAIAYGIHGDHLEPRPNSLGLDACNTDLRYACTLRMCISTINWMLGWIEEEAAFQGWNKWQMENGFAEVHRSNMSKFWSLEECDAFLRNTLNPQYIFKQSPCGRFVVKNYDGKVIKSPSYSKANLGPILEGKV